MFNDNFMTAHDRYRIARAMSDDPNVQMDIQRDMIISRYLEQQREEQLINKIADRVIQRISVSVDVKDAIMQIEELKKALNSLGN